MAVKITQKLKNIREELTALSFAGAEKKKIYLNNLVDNGDFSNGTTGWTAYRNATLSNDNGRLKVFSDTSTAGASASQQFATKIGHTYKVSVNVVEIEAGAAARIAVGSGSGNLSDPTSTDFVNDNIIPVGSYTYYFTATTENTWIILSSQYNTTPIKYVMYDNVSVQEVGDNMVVNGDFDYDGVWDKETGWTISGGTASCDGSQTNNVGFKQSRSDLKGELITGKQYTLTFTLSGHSGGGVQPHIRNLGYGTYITGDGTYTISLTGGTGNDGLNFYVQSDFVGSIDNVILSEGSHHVTQSLPKDLDVSRVFINGELAREGENYDYQIKTDGINQWLKPTVEPTATTETAVIGVYK